jgi:1-phosphatidylinositol-4-phosphate 5-kinase
VSADGKHLYFIGIIDTLTGYGGVKVLENTLKSIVYDSKTISCIPPDKYGDRFYQFMMKEVFAE